MDVEPKRSASMAGVTAPPLADRPPELTDAARMRTAASVTIVLHETV